MTGALSPRAPKRPGSPLVSPEKRRAPEPLFSPRRDDASHLTSVSLELLKTTRDHMSFKQETVNEINSLGKKVIKIASDVSHISEGLKIVEVSFLEFQKTTEEEIEQLKHRLMVMETYLMRGGRGVFAPALQAGDESVAAS